jgi:hypothetical protein
MRVMSSMGMNRIQHNVRTKLLYIKTPQLWYESRLLHPGCIAKRLLSCVNHDGINHIFLWYPTSKIALDYRSKVS